MGRHQSRSVFPTRGLDSLEGPRAFPGPQAAARYPRSSGRTRQVCPLPDSVAGSRSRRRCRRRRRCRSPSAGLQQGAGKGTLARSGNRWEGGGVEPAGDTPSPAPGHNPHPRLHVLSTPSAHLSSPAKQARDPRPGPAPTGTPSKPRARREDSWGRGWRPQSLGGYRGARAPFARKRAGAGQTLQAPRMGREGEGSRKVYRGKPSILGAGRLEKLKPRSGCPETPGRDASLPGPHTGRIWPSCGWVWG